MILEELLELLDLSVVDEALELAPYYVSTLRLPETTVTGMGATVSAARNELAAKLAGQAYAPLARWPKILVARPSRTSSERNFKECTRSVIFLLQRRQAMWLDVAHPPDGWEFDTDTSQLVALKAEDGAEKVRLTALQAFMAKMDCAFAYWRTESVWLSREEAEEYAQTRVYDYHTPGVHYQVYGTCAEGRLEKVLAAT